MTATRTSRRSTPASGTSAESGSAACGEAGCKGVRKTRRTSFEAHAGAAGAVPSVQGRLGRDCGEDTERAGHAVCLSLLPAFAPRVRAGAGIPQAAPRAVGQAAPGGGVGRLMPRSLKKGPFIDDHLREKVECAERAQRKESGEDLVAPLDDSAGHDRAHDRRAQREEVHSGVHHRADGGTQAGRIRAHAHVQGPRGEGGAREGGGSGSSGSARSRGTEQSERSEAQEQSEGRHRSTSGTGNETMATATAVHGPIEGLANARFVRVSPQKARLVVDLIRGQRAEDALQTLRFTKKRVAKDIEKTLAQRDRQRRAQGGRFGRIARRGRAVRVALLRERRAALEADASGADGPRLPLPEAHEPHRGRGGRASRAPPKAARRRRRRKRKLRRA